MDLGGCLGTESLMSEILKRLPVKSLVRFMSVSKPWSHLISDPFFVTYHHQFNKSSSSSFVLGINFRHNQKIDYFRIAHTKKTKMKHLKIPFLWRLKTNPKHKPIRYGISIRGHCNGLILVFDSQTFLVNEGTRRAKSKPFHVERYIISNPIARRFLILPESTIEPPNLNLEVNLEKGYECKKLNAIGLGFIDDVVYKVVRVTYGMAHVSPDHIEGFKPYEPPWVEAYDSRSCYWRRVSINSEFSYKHLDDGVYNSFDGCLYWFGIGYGNENRESYSTLVSFHLVDETWHETLIPYKSRYGIIDRHYPGDGVIREYGFCQFVQILGESVVLFVGDQRDRLVCNVWKMNKEDDNKVSWTHMKRLNFGGSPLGFIGGGEILLMKESCKEGYWTKLVLHDLKKRRRACFGFLGLDFRVGNIVPGFVESLVLLQG